MHGPRRANPADAQSAPGELAERTDGDDLLAGIERGDRRGAVDAERQVGGQVLHDQEAGLARHPREVAPASLGHDRAGRVVERRDDIDEADRCAGPEQADDLDPRPLAVDRDRDQSIARRPEGVDGADVGRVLHHDRAPRAAELGADEVQGLLGAARDEDLVRVRGDAKAA